jgi:peptidyl-prolyl cis-trans isomerase B (cyclophilin B)
LRFANNGGQMKNEIKLDNYLAKQKLKEERAVAAKRDNRIFPAIAAGALVLALLGQLAYFGFGPGSVTGDVVEQEESAPEAEQPTAERENDEAVPDPSLSENRIWQGSMQLNGAEIGFELDGAAAPQAVANFVSLIEAGYFENVSCHRLVTAGIYVLQCGDPDGTGAGGPGYNWGPIENAPADDIYSEGVIAMARVGGDDYSMGSQFFIVYQESQIPSDSVGGYTVFGKLTSGLDAVTAIADLGTENQGSDGPPIEPVVMTAISVE